MNDGKEEQIKDNWNFSKHFECIKFTEFFDTGKCIHFLYLGTENQSLSRHESLLRGTSRNKIEKVFIQLKSLR